MLERYSSIDFVFGPAPDDVFVVRSFSEVMSPKPKSPFANISELVGIGVSALEDKFSPRLAPLLLHTSQDTDSLYISGKIDFLPFAEFSVPFVYLPGKYAEHYFFVNIHNFLACLTHGKSLDRMG